MTPEHFLGKLIKIKMKNSAWIRMPERVEFPYKSLCVRYEQGTILYVIGWEFIKIDKTIIMFEVIDPDMMTTLIAFDYDKVDRDIEVIA